MSIQKNKCEDIFSIYNFSYPENLPQLNGIKVNKITTQDIVCNGVAFINGSIQGNTNLDKIRLGYDGSQTEPSLSFVSDNTVGLYKSGSNIGFTDGIVSNSINTSSGDLYLNPQGNNINCMGKNIINVGSIYQSPNKFDVIGSTIITIDSTPTTILSIGLDEALYNCNLVVLGVSGNNFYNSEYSLTISYGNNTFYNINNKLLSATINDISINFDIGVGIFDVVVVSNTYTTKWIATATLTRQLY